MQYIIIGIFIIGYLIFIYITRRENNYENYAVAGRKVGPLLLFLSMCALFTGPGWTLGLTQQGYSTGYFALFVASFYGFGKITEGIFIAPRLRKKFKNAYSIGEVVGGENGHNNVSVQILTGIISFGLLIGFSTIMSKAAGEILNNFIGIDKFYGILIITGIVTLYSVFGGLRSSMLTDAFQFTFIAFLIISLLLLIIYNSDVNYNDFLITAKENTLAEINSTTWSAVIGLVVTWFFGEMLVPPTINGILGSRSPKTAKFAISLSGITMIFWLFIMLTIGILASQFLSLDKSNDQVLLEISKLNFNNTFYTLFSLALIGVVMSTQDSLINSSSITFGKDILKPLKLDEKLTYLYSRIVCVFAGLLSILFASFLPSIIDSLLLFYSIWIPSMLIPLLFSVFKNKLNWQSAVVSMITGIVISLFWNKLEILKSIPIILIGIFFSLSAYLISDLIIAKYKVYK